MEDVCHHALGHAEVASHGNCYCSGGSGRPQNDSIGQHLTYFCAGRTHQKLAAAHRTAGTTLRDSCILRAYFCSYMLVARLLQERSGLWLFELAGIHVGPILLAVTCRWMSHFFTTISKPMDQGCGAACTCGDQHVVNWAPTKSAAPSMIVSACTNSINVAPTAVMAAPHTSRPTGNGRSSIMATG